MERLEHLRCFYVVRIDESSEIFTGDEIADMFEDCDEMIIKSRKFETYDDCLNALSSLLSAFTLLTSEATGKPRVIVSKVNPRFATSEKQIPIKGESWDDETITRLYVADAVELKNNSLLSFSITGEIRFDPQDVDLITRLLPGDVQ